MSPSSRRPAPVFTLVGWSVVLGGGGLSGVQIAGGEDGGPQKGQQRALPGGIVW